MERSKQNDCVVGDKDNGVNGRVDDSKDVSDKHLTHPSQAVDCHSMERSKKNMHVVGNIVSGVDDSVDNCDDSANKQLTHLKNWIIVV
eukprot:15330944-Ditylum_brightwellii.AAC.1